MVIENHDQNDQITIKNHGKVRETLMKTGPMFDFRCAPGDVQREARHRNGVGVFILLLSHPKPIQKKPCLRFFWGANHAV